MCECSARAAEHQANGHSEGKKAGERDHTVPANKWEVHYRLGQVATLSDEREVS
jgi:hypothetical protein